MEMSKVAVEAVVEVASDVTVHGMIAFATACVGYAAVSATRADAAAESSRAMMEMLTTGAVDGTSALVFPLMLSAMLLAMYFLFAYIGVFVALVAIGYAVAGLILFLHAAIVAAGWAPLMALASPLPIPPWPLPRGYVALGLALAAGWLGYGGWVLNNALAAGMVVLVVTLMRLPNLKIGYALLLGLVVFDVAWVFYSAPVFGDNVMVKVATSEAVNPARTVATSLSLPGRLLAYIPRKLPMINKLVVPYSDGRGYAMLGLGDLALPGVLLAFGLRMDRKLGKRVRPSLSLRTYFGCALAAYYAGLWLALVASRMMRHPQPALLYLVPATLAAISLRGLVAGELRALWQAKPLVAADGPPV
ncbi:signal peptide peptidase 3 [Thecamonas trahens ATCC 50062]|uniref:Signal peptide peptidase 3 n=1 Tax=Thecamonas trahens ATCC 50062 TaxID=461836 RepID=A0A0L0D875_THETB|nr:signal peptide peptidase 3 [Thecamonas trahens ATCC 50062]KNC48544.1 signal peptide peptidase 3 [Thecamonas trahens ATCC 50062]|eukprot:XP_013758651.1 signal peptide peptidase 3 [Thecamonas trahens ATCC 50062]